MKKRKMTIVVLALAGAVTGWAQDEVELREVVVSGARTVQKADRQIVYPTRQQLDSSPSGYSLLAKLALPHIRIDEAMHSVTTIGTTGGVQVRINDLPATTDELLALDMAAVEAVEFIDQPSLRYGESLAYVINIKVKRPVSGYTLGTNLSQWLNNASGSGTGYGKVNIGKSELGLNYHADYQCKQKTTSTDETARYLLTDGSTATAERHSETTLQQTASHQAQLTYSLADSAYVLQARLSGSRDLKPAVHVEENSYSLTTITQHPSPNTQHPSPNTQHPSPNTQHPSPTPYQNENSASSETTSLDLYLHREWRHQSLTANVVGTYIGSDATTERNEGSAYRYATQGDTYSLWAETFYDNQLKPFTLSLGAQYMQRYMDNRYTGDASAHTTMHTSGQYVYGRLQGKLWQRLSYVADLGGSRRYHSQGSDRQNMVLLRSKLNLVYPLARHLRLRYSLELSQHMSQIALISRVSIKQNDMETLVGNPDIKPNRVNSHDLRLSYNTDRLDAELQAYYRGNPDCNMPKVVRTEDDRFQNTQTNQRACNFFFVQPYVRWEALPEHLTVTAYCGVYRFFNYGDDYTHTYTSLNGAVSVQAYLGKWSLTAYADNGYRWMEGENRGYQGAACQLAAHYRVSQSLTLAAYWLQPFDQRPHTSKGQQLNRYVEKSIDVVGLNQGNLVGLNLTWNLSRGRKYREVNRSMNHQDTETGILK